MSKIHPWYVKYLEEVFEALVTVTTVNILIDKKIDFLKIIKGAVVIGIMSSVLDWYNPEYRTSLKSSIVSTVGSTTIKSI